MTVSKNITIPELITIELALQDREEKILNKLKLVHAMEDPKYRQDCFKLWSQELEALKSVRKKMK
jgi:hypothetical protein